MPKIEFYLTPDRAEGSPLIVPVTGRDFSSSLAAAEKKLVNCNWRAVFEESSGRAFYKPKGVGCMCKCSSEGGAEFMTTDFKTYVSISRYYDNSAFSSQTLDRMKVSSVGGVVRTIDGKVFIHRRSKKATHIPGAIDSSIAGICHVKNRFLNFRGAILSKLEKELKTFPEDILDMRFTGIHSSREPDFSGMYTFDISTSLSESQIADRAKSSPFEEFYFVGENKLEELILKEFNPSQPQPLCLDGCAALLAILPAPQFYKTAQKLIQNGINIQFGELKG